MKSSTHPSVDMRAENGVIEKQRTLPVRSESKTATASGVKTSLLNLPSSSKPSVPSLPATDAHVAHVEKGQSFVELAVKADKEANFKIAVPFYFNAVQSLTMALSLSTSQYS